MARRLEWAGPTENCEGGCGSKVRASKYEGASAPRMNRVVDGRDQPGGHTARDCQRERGRR